MKYTDAKILETHAKIARDMAEDPFLAVCHDLLGYTPMGVILNDDSEYRAFEASYKRLITPAVTAAVGIPRALKAAHIALEHEVVATEADKDRPLDQFFRLQDIVNVLQVLMMLTEKPARDMGSNHR